MGLTPKPIRREERGRRKNFLMVSPLVAALYVDNGSVFLVVLCSLRLTTGPRCLASWLVRTRRTVFHDYGALTVDAGSGMCRAGFTGYAPRAVFLLLAVRPRCSARRPVWTRGTVTPRSSSSRQWYVHFDCRQARVAGHHGAPGQVARCPCAQRHASWSGQCRCMCSCSS